MKQNSSISRLPSQLWVRGLYILALVLGVTFGMGALKPALALWSQPLTLKAQVSVLASTKYVESSLASAGCTPAVGSSGTGNQLLATPATFVDLSATGPATTTEAIYFSFTTAATAPNLTTWAAGTYTVELDVRAAPGQVDAYRIQILRVNSSCTTATILATSASTTGTGLKTFTLAGVGASTGAATDRFQVRVLVDSGGGASKARTMTIRVNTTDAEVVTPW